MMEKSLLPYIPAQFNCVLFWFDIFLPHTFSLRSTIRPVVSNETWTILKFRTKVLNLFSTENRMCSSHKMFAGNFGMFTCLFKTSCVLLKDPENAG